MTLYDVFDWLELTPIGETIRGSIWMFPVIESVHLLGLALLGGAVLVVDLRLLGFGLAGRSAASVARAARPWLYTGITVMFATGVPLFLSEAIKCFYSRSFWVKMSALLAVLLFTFGVRNRLAMREHTSSMLLKAVGAVSLALWFTVAAAGRWIGFS